MTTRPKDHEIAAFVNALRDIAREFGQTQQLRARIANAVLDFLDGHNPGATMTLKIRVSNEDDHREIEVIPVDPNHPEPLAPARATIIGPQATQEFWVHSSQAFLVREVAP